MLKDIINEISILQSKIYIEYKPVSRQEIDSLIVTILDYIAQYGDILDENFGEILLALNDYISSNDEVDLVKTNDMFSFLVSPFLLKLR